MTQEQKDLLLKDLCARLPYGVICKDDYAKVEGKLVQIGINYDMCLLSDDYGKTEFAYIPNCKAYLLPLSSMTEEQKEFIKNKFCYDWDIDDHPYSLWTYCIGIGDVDELIDWFHKNHFDYRGLIPMGLANDATGLNIY